MPSAAESEEHALLQPTAAPTSTSPPPGPASDPPPYRTPIVHFSSISVQCQLAPAESAQTGTLQIVERDDGAANDFWSIRVDLSWRPFRDPSARGLCVSVDALLTVRLSMQDAPPTANLHLRGGALLARLAFPNGREAAAAFWDALLARVHAFPLPDPHQTSQLYAVEKKPRMRRAVPVLAEQHPIAAAAAAAAAAEEDFSALLQDLSLKDPAASATAKRGAAPERKGRNRGEASNGDFGLMMLSQFAKVTQVARDVGEEISLLLDEKKRRAEGERKERERAARRRALDIYADIVASTDVERELPPRLTLDEKRGVPVSLDVWREAFEESGKLKDPVVMKQAIFAGGIEPDLRPQVWPFILGFYSWGSSEAERREVFEKKRADYAKLKERWLSLQSAAKTEDADALAKDEQAVNVDRRKRVSKPHADCLDIEEQIAKDIIRTDRELELYKQDGAPATLVMGTLLNVYATYDNQITYCQGMSDFLSPILHVIGVDNEALAFWCFESLMQRIEGNFRVDQSGMRAQLSKLKNLVELSDEELAAFFKQSDPDYYCCFRWLLVRFKRELPFEVTARMWEVLWSRQVGGDDLHIFVAAALLVAHRQQLLSLPRGAFDSLLRYVNDMSMRIDVDFALREGELCFRKYGELVQQVE